jgi:RNA chaperone Hfq
VIDPDEKPDTADTVSDADADVVEASAVRPEGSKAAPKNEQFAGLNRLRRERTWVDVYLIGGTCLHGQIRSFDASMMLLQTRSGDIALYHHAISTVVRGQKRGGGAKPKRRPGFEGRSGSSGYESRPAHRPPRPLQCHARVAPAACLLPCDPAEQPGTLAIIMPSVVPSTTGTKAWYCAASATVAIWVLSPISARKKATSVVPKTPMRANLASLSSNLSGISVQIAMAMKDSAQHPAQPAVPSRW